MGVGVAAAKAVGSGDTGKLKDIIRTAAGLTCLLALVFTVLGLLMAPMCLRWMRTPEEILPSAVGYLRLYLLSLISIVSYNIGSGILRALGNTRSPMLYQLFGGIANLLGNTLFIYCLNWGVQGAALATACSQGLAALLTVAHLCRMKTEYRLRLGKMKLDKAICKDFLAVGIPSAVQAIVITLSNLIVQTHINQLGVDSIAAFTAYFKVENFIYLPIMAFGQACSTFTSQNIGARQVERVKKRRQHIAAFGRCGDHCYLGADSHFFPVCFRSVCQRCFRGSAGKANCLGCLSVLFCVRFSGSLCLSHPGRGKSAACYGDHCGEYVPGTHLRTERDSVFPAQCHRCGGGLSHYLGVHSGVPAAVLSKQPVASYDESGTMRESPLGRAQRQFFPMGFP